jgi:hypothetical protein
MSSTQRFRYVTEEIMLLENNYYEMNGADITQLIHRAWVHHLPYVLKFLFVSLILSHLSSYMIVVVL